METQIPISLHDRTSTSTTGVHLNASYGVCLTEGNSDMVANAEAGMPPGQVKRKSGLRLAHGRDWRAAGSCLCSRRRHLVDVLGVWCVQLQEPMTEAPRFKRRETHDHTGSQRPTRSIFLPAFGLPTQQCPVTRHHVAHETPARHVRGAFMCRTRCEPFPS